jgi:hypothetical protein
LSCSTLCVLRALIGHPNAVWLDAGIANRIWLDNC